MTNDYGGTHTVPPYMAQTCAKVTKTKVFPDGKKGCQKCLSAYGVRTKNFFEKVRF